MTAPDVPGTTSPHAPGESVTRAPIASGATIPSGAYISYRAISDRDTWNNALLCLPLNHVLQSWDWGAVKRRHGWTPVRLLWERDNRPVAAARVLWPFGERGLAKRLHRIRVPVLLLWGEGDRLVPPEYAKRFAAGLAGPVDTKILPGAGHQVWIDEPEASAAAIAEFLA